MTLPDALNLLKGLPLLPNVPATWADLGCGSGLFTTALAQLLPAGSVIHAIDREQQKIKQPANGVAIEFTHADFITDTLPLPPLDGILMANSLHYVKDQERFLGRMQSHLHHDSRWLIVEYDTARSNPWVPYPIEKHQLAALFGRAGYHTITALGSQPSRFRQGDLYAAILSR